MSRPAVSQALKVFKAAGLFTERFGDFKPREHNMRSVPIVKTVFEAQVGGHTGTSTGTARAGILLATASRPRPLAARRRSRPADGKTPGVADGLTAEERYFFDVNGYLVLDGVLPPEESRRLNAVISARKLAPGPSIANQRFESELLLWDRGFRDLLDHPVVLPRLRDLLGAYLRLDHAYGIVMAPRTSGLGLHGGATPWDPSQYYVHRDGRIYNGLTTVTWSLVDAEPGHGGFGCIPGSHKAAERLPDAVPAHWVKEIPLAAGSVLIFTEALTHCTLPWNAPYERRAVLFKYAPGHMAWGGHRDPPAELWAALTGTQRRLFQPPAVAPHDPVV